MLLIPQYLTIVLVRKEKSFSWLSELQLWPQSQGKSWGRFPSCLPSSLLLDCLLVQFAVRERSTKALPKYYHLLLQPRSLPARECPPSPEPASLIMAAGSQQGRGDRVTSLASLPIQLPYQCVSLAWACPMDPGVGLRANSRWRAQSLGTHQPVRIWKDFGSHPCQYSPAAAATGFKYSPRFTTMQILKLALCMIM